jgi:hypothetical protein
MEETQVHEPKAKTHLKEEEPIAEEKQEARQHMDLKGKSDRLDFAFLAAAMILFSGGIELIRETQSMTGPSQTLYAVATILVTAFAAYFAHIYVKLMKD